MRRNKTIIISILLVAVVLMTIGYAILATSLNINGSTAVTSNWQVEFSDIRTVSLKGGATNKVNPTVSKTTANFEVDLVQPGDEVTYEIDITNYGDIEAEVKGATYTSTGSDAIYIRFDGIRKGTRIASCEGQSTCPKVTIIVKVGYDASVTSDPEEKTKDISITLDIGQYVSSNPTPDGELLPELGYPTLVEQILNGNKIKSDIGIDFSKTSEEDGTKGLYYTSTNTEDNKTVSFIQKTFDITFRVSPFIMTKAKDFWNKKLDEAFNNKLSDIEKDEIISIFDTRNDLVNNRTSDYSGKLTPRKIIKLINEVISIQKIKIFEDIPIVTKFA